MIKKSNKKGQFIDKKGFLRVLEAIIAIIVVFGFIVFITPRAGDTIVKTPKPVEDTMASILNQIESNPEFRYAIMADECFVKGSSGYVLIKNYINENIPGGAGSIWSYKFSLCRKGDDGEDLGCLYYWKYNNEDKIEESISQNKLPEDTTFMSISSNKDVYSKNTYVTVADASGVKPDSNCDDARLKSTIFTIYFWQR